MSLLSIVVGVLASLVICGGFAFLYIMYRRGVDWQPPEFDDYLGIVFDEDDIGE